jgi:Rrf2 family protein
MKLSFSARYGLITMMYIAQKGELVLSQEIARTCHIPLDYLLKVLQLLVRAGVLRSRRGPNGGYTLAHSAAKISYLNIIEAIDGPAEFRLVPQKEQLNGLTREIEKVCNRAFGSFNSVLKKATLAQTLKKLP